MRRIYFLIVFLSLLLVGSITVNAAGYWECRKQGNSCISTCIGTLQDCYAQALCDCINSVQPPSNPPSIDLPSQVLFTLNNFKNFSNSTKVQVNLSASSFSKISYSDNGKRPKIPCRFCNNVVKNLNFKNGTHSLFFIAEERNASANISINLTVDIPKRTRLRLFG